MKFLTIIFLFLSVFYFSQEIDCPVENGVTYYNESYEFRTKFFFRNLEFYKFIKVFYVENTLYSD